MIDLKNIVPKDYIEASFSGYDENGIFLNVSEPTDSYEYALYDREGNWKELPKAPEQTGGISYKALYKAIRDENDWRICGVYYYDGEYRASFLRNTDLKIKDTCKQEMYDKRTLFGEPIFIKENMGIIPFYQENGILALAGCEGKENVYEKQIKNEIVYKHLSEDEDGAKHYSVYVKCKRIKGSYMGIIAKEHMYTGDIARVCVEYSSYKEDNQYAYMMFCMDEEFDTDAKEYYIVWSYSGQNYFAPLAIKKTQKTAEIIDIQYKNGEGIEFTVSYDADSYGVFEKLELINDVNEWEEAYNINLTDATTTEEEDDGDGNITCTVTCTIDTKTVFDRFGSWLIKLSAIKEEEKNLLDVIIDDSLMAKDLYDNDDSKYKLTFKKKDGSLVINRVFDHNALFSKNIQSNSFECIDDFLNIEGISPRGNMFAEYMDIDGRLGIRLYQQMDNVIEAKLVMYHSQGMGVLATQNLEIIDGVVKEFVVETPDIDWDNKFEKPVGSVWFRVAIAIRTGSGIYFSALTQYDLDTDIEQEGNIYDSRKLYLKPIGNNLVCGIEMTALPYYAANKLVSMKYVRPEQLYRSQFTNELLDVKIKKDILIVKMRCRDCGGEYKGVLMEYRKVKEDDTETYLIPYDSLKKKKDYYIMTTKIDMKKYYMRMLYWDIRCAFEIDDKIYTVSCHSNNKRFLRKYKNVFVDRTYPNDNSIMFPYATGNDSVALMHREECPQDHWQFRLKEKVARGIYKCFKNHWDKKNIYLIFEKYCTMAQDNGYFFFKYCMDANVEADFDGEILYVIDPKAADWEKVVPYKKHVIKYLSLKHMIYIQACRLMISTDTKGHAYVWRSMGSDIKALTYKKKLVFLQHGVTAFKRGHFERGTNVGCESFITTSQFEHDIIHNYLKYPEKEVPITGFARWDVLHDKSEGHREILMMPTWRTWLDDAENEVFAESDYCKNYMALLNDPRLDDILKRYDVTLNFYLHPKFRKFITEFSVVSENIRLIPFGEEPLNELMMTCNLLITDFSSVAWDVYYMNKPVLFYHFDLDDAYKTLGFYMDMRNDIFGERAEEPEGLMQLIIEYIENGFVMKEKYSKDREKYFAYVDDNNSERIWKAIQEREW